MECTDRAAPPTERHLRPTDFLDSAHPWVVAFTREHAGSGSDLERARRLFLAVRDLVRYDPYSLSNDPAAYRASAVLERRAAFCVPKAIAARHFSEAEWQEVTRRAGREQQEYFFRCWTHKEAFLKATGAGLSGSLQAVEVPPRGQVSVRDQPQWLFQVFRPAEGCPGAVAVDRQVDRWEWLQLPVAS